MEIRFMWKAGESNVGNCPAQYKAPGGYVIQGKRLDDATRAQLRDLGSDEDAVFVPADVIDGPGRRLMRTPITDDEFGDLLRSFRRTAFYCETQETYALDYEAADFERFLAGSPCRRPRSAGGARGLTRSPS